MEKTIILDINGSEIRFDVGMDAYNKFINEMTPNNKVSPAHNFLMRTVSDDSRDALKSLLEMPGAAVEIVGNLVEEYTPDLNITVGKSKGSPTK